MPRILRDLTITNVDRTWKGKNPGAVITMFKAIPAILDKETTMFVLEDADEATQEAFAELQAKIDEATTAEPTEEAIAAAVAKAIGEMSPAEVVDAADGVIEAPEEEESVEDLMKGLPPELQEQLAKGVKASEEVALLKAEKRQEKFVAVAKADMSGLTETSDDIGKVLAIVADATADDSDESKLVERVLKAAGAQADKALETLGAEAGATGSASVDGAEAALMAQAEKIGLEKGISKYVALLELSDSNSELVQKAHDES